MRTRLIVIALSGVAACGDNIQPAEDQVTAVSGEDGGGEAEGGGGGDEEPGTLVVTFSTDPLDCDDHNVSFLVNVLQADPPLTEEPICRYEFADGTTELGCGVIHSLPTPQLVTLTARHPVTGAIGRDEQLVAGLSSWDATADVTTDGQTISWDVQTLYGDTPGLGSLQVISIEPSDKVVEIVSSADPFQGSARVSEPGTYTVTLNAFIQFGEVAGCSRFITKTIEVICPKE